MTLQMKRKSGLWHICYEPKPLPSRMHDWEAWPDGREEDVYLSGSTIFEVVHQIREWEDDNGATCAGCREWVDEADIHTTDSLPDARWHRECLMESRYGADEYAMEVAE